MSNKPNYLDILQTLAKLDTPANLAHTNSAGYDSASNAMITLAELFEDIEDCYRSVDDIDFEDKDALRKEYGLDDDDESELILTWICDCEEYNREQISRILDKFGIMVGWKISVPEDTEIIVRKPAFEHCTGHVLVYPANRHDEEEAEEDYDNDYTKTTVFDAVQDAVKEIIAIDRKGVVGSRTPTDLWRRRLAVKVLQEIESL